jgi:hypothetical protein
MLDLSYVVNYLLERKLELKSTHSRLCFPIIDRIYRKMLVGIKFSPIKVDEGIIIDGQLMLIYLKEHQQRKSMNGIQYNSI